MSFILTLLGGPFTSTIFNVDLPFSTGASTTFNSQKLQLDLLISAHMTSYTSFILLFCSVNNTSFKNLRFT